MTLDSIRNSCDVYPDYADKMECLATLALELLVCRSEWGVWEWRARGVIASNSPHVTRTHHSTTLTQDPLPRYRNSPGNDPQIRNMFRGNLYLLRMSMTENDMNWLLNFHWIGLFGCVEGLFPAWCGGNSWQLFYCRQQTLGTTPIPANTLQRDHIWQDHCCNEGNVWRGVFSKWSLSLGMGMTREGHQSLEESNQSWRVGGHNQRYLSSTSWWGKHRAPNICTLFCCWKSVA